MSKTNERELALYALTDIFNLQAYNNIVLRKLLNEHSEMTAVQKAFVTELVNGTLRNVITIDYVIDSFSKTKTKKMKPFILNNLRVGVYQLLYTDKIPESAACNEAVKLAKKHGFSSLSGFVNGVLRNIARNKDNITFPDKNKDKVKYLSVKYSYCEDIIKYWLETLPFEKVENLCISGSSVPSVSIAVNTIKTTVEKLKTDLEADGMEVSYGKLNKNSLTIKKTSDLTHSKAYIDGLFHVMDESSALAVNVLDPTENSSVLDVCAAPGGKSLACAYKMNGKGSITSRDLYPHKLELISATAERLGIDILKPEQADALENSDEEKYDYVIVDAPCSGLGLVRKKPDIKYNKTKDDITALAKIQRDILTASQKSVKKGGFLLYSTCTVSAEENEKNAKWFAESFDFELIDISTYLPEKYKDEGKGGIVQILTGTDGADGFFISKFRRKQNG